MRGTADEEHRRTVQPLGATHGLGQREGRVRTLYPAGSLIPLQHLKGGRVLGPGQYQLAAPEERVIHEETAHQIMVVAHSVRRTARGGEQQSGILDPAAGEDVAAGDDPHPPPIPGPRLHIRNSTTRGDERQRMHVQEQANVGRRPKLAAECRREIGGPAVAVADRLHRATLPSVTDEPGPLEPPIVKMANGGSTAVERLEMVTAERPACVRHARARLEIDRIQRPALGGPTGGAAAEHAKPRLAGREALATDVSPMIEQLRGVPEGLAATGEHRDPRLVADKLPRQRDARRPSAQDAQIGLDGASILQLVGVDQRH